MAIYNFSDIASKTIKSQAFTVSDTLVFDASVDASKVTLVTSGANLIVKLIDNYAAVLAGTVTTAAGLTYLAATTITLTGFASTQIGSTTFQFDNGSVLVFGDGTTTNTTDNGNNTLVGTDFNDYLNGFTGVDTVTYAAVQLGGVKIDLTKDLPQDTGSSGFDTLLGIENVIGTIFSDNITGSALANRLDGGAGVDTLAGGAVYDFYVVTAGDRVNESLSSGIDTIMTHVDFSMATVNNVENLTLLSDATNGTAVGNSLANTITGNVGNNILDGGTNAGATATDGAADSLIGGDGNDVYLVRDSTDVVTETNTSAAQVDTILDYFTGAVLPSSATTASISAAGITMADNVENARLVGTVIAANASTTAVNITGNALNNLIYANALANAINGGAGSDTVSYQYKANSGVTVTLSNDAVSGSGGDLLVNIENVIGTNYSDKLTGDSTNNSLVGGRGADILDGGAGGFDSLIGGKGNDTYLVDSAGVDAITELANEGTDVVVGKDLSIDISSPAYVNIENAQLTNSTVVGLNLTGSSGANTLIGNTTANIISGGTGDDILYDADITLAGATATSVAAVAANTAYLAIVTAAGGATATLAAVKTEALTTSANALLVQASSAIADAIKNAAVGSAVSALTTTVAGIGGTGGTLSTVVLAQGAALTAAQAGGSDNMAGGTGNDTYYVNKQTAQINESANAGTDTVISSVSYSISEIGTVNPLAFGVENLTITGTAATATGNSLANNLVGNAAANTLTGGLGADTMSGGAGNDTYFVDNTGDKVIEYTGAASTDTGGTADLVSSSVTYTLGLNVEKLTLTGTDNINATGNSQNNIIIGNTGNNSITGGAGNDTMTGGGGTDTYYVDSTADVVNGGTGIDTVLATITTVGGSYSISMGTTPDAIENLTVNGTNNFNLTGNTLANVLTGNSGNNTIDGGTGTGADTTIDTMVGLGGDDTYTVDSSLDVVVESASVTGIDLVSSSASYDLSMLTLFGSQIVATANGAGIEKLTLTGTAANATGNTISNTLTGNASDNIIVGGAGNDTMVGAGGNDTYGVDATLDVVTELAAAGTTDKIVSSVTYTLPDNVENLTLGVLTIAAGSAVITSTATTSISATGNSAGNTLTGNAGANSIDGAEGNDTINGGAGKDKLTGGDGNDVFVFTAAIDSGASAATAATLKSAADVISDYKVANASDGSATTDTIDLSAINGAAVFTLHPTASLTSFATFTLTNQLQLVSEGADLVIYGNTDATLTTAEFAIILTGYANTALTLSADILS